MFARNRLQAGEFVTLVPVGLPVTLQYSVQGAIQSVWKGHDDRSDDITDIILPSLLKYNQVPRKISIHGGSSFVKGVLYTDMQFADTGELPNCIEAGLIAAYTENPESFTFYAGEVSSTATVFRGAVPIRQWLTFAGFETLPGYAVRAGLTEEQFENMVKKEYPFQYPLIASYILFHVDGSVSYPNVGLSQLRVTDVAEIVDEYGTIQARITLDDNSLQSVQVVPWAEVVQLDIFPKDMLVCDAENQLIFNLNPTKTKRSRQLSCSCCGRQLTVPTDLRVKFQCTDPQCNSTMYPKIVQLLQTLKLDVISFDRYQNYLSSGGKILTILDVFTMPEYQSVKVSTTVVDALRAIIPRTVLPNRTQIVELVNQCNNSVDTLLYYLRHLDKLKVDLSLDPHAFRRFYDWISDSGNLLDVVSIFDLDNIDLHVERKLFNGPPIFRDKHIYLTGTFLHGSMQELSAILSSYGADSTCTYNDSIDLVLVGDVAENVNGHSIRAAQKSRIPVMKESEFFAQYQIDDDMAQNLK